MVGTEDLPRSRLPPTGFRHKPKSYVLRIAGALRRLVKYAGRGRIPGPANPQYIEACEATVLTG